MIWQLINEYGTKVPSTGLPTDDIYSIFIELIERKKQVLILILDEIDQLVKKAGDGIIYNLTRLNSDLKNTQINLFSVVGQIVYQNNIPQSSNINIDVSKFAEGIYILNIESKTYSKSFKIIKQ